MMIKKKIIASEHEIQNSIIEYLKFRHFYVIRLNSGSFKTKTGFVRMAEAGTPDLMAFRNHQGGLELWFIEVKRLGANLTTLQFDKLQELKSYGANVLCAHSVEEVQQYI